MTGGLLSEILAHKRRELDAARAALGLEELKGRVRGMPRCRNFFKAVTSGGGLPRVIAEVKKASPSAGVICSDFDPSAIAMAYQRCGAAAVSVLTDRRYFKGCIEDLAAVKGTVSLPVLRKDFIIDPWQVYESRAAGADAILLIAEALKPADLMDLMILAAEMTLTVLLEVHGADTLLQVRSLVGFPKAGNSILGINNRDLATLHVDIGTTARLGGLLEEGTAFVAESGIHTRGDLEKVKAAGASAVLVGEALCGSDSIEQKYTELFGQCR